MSEILSRTVFETCLADQTEAPWEEEVRLLLAHDAALRLALAEAERERDEEQRNHDAAEGRHTDTIAAYHADLMAARAERDEARAVVARLQAWLDEIPERWGRPKKPAPPSAPAMRRGEEP